MSYQVIAERDSHTRRIKKKSFEVEQEELRARSETRSKTNKTTAAAKPAELLPSDFSIPRITVKKVAPSPQDTQIQMAEIAEKPVPEPDDTIELPEEETDANLVPGKPAVVLTAETLAQAMSEFADKQKMSMKTLLKTLALSHKDTQLKLVLGSKSQLDMIEPIRIDILAFFRSWFSSNLLQLEIVIDESREVISAQPYSAREKLAAMVKNNPDLMYLIEKLNLKVK